MPGSSVVDAAMATLDTVVETEYGADRPRCSLIKLDVEGFEMEALGGAESVVANDRPVIFGEFNPDWLKARGVPLEAPGVWCAEREYLPLSVKSERRTLLSDRRRITLEASKGRAAHAALVLVPKERAEAVIAGR